jgi:hypothetical protein
MRRTNINSLNRAGKSTIPWQKEPSTRFTASDTTRAGREEKGVQGSEDQGNREKKQQQQPRTAWRRVARACWLDCRALHKPGNSAADLVNKESQLKSCSKGS